MKYRQAQTIKSGFHSSLCGICIDRKDRLYVAGDYGVNTFDAAGAPGGQWSTARPGLCVAVSEDGAAWVGEAGQVEVFDAAGKLTRTWRDPQRLGEVTAIGFHHDDVLVADANDRAIRRFDKSGRFINNIGKENRLGGFLIPNGVLDFCVDAAGIIHAANPGKHRVERYNLDGHLLGAIGRFDGVDPEGFSGCCNPTNLALGEHGRVYVTEKADPRAKVLDAHGKLVAVIATHEFDPNAKNMDVAVDSRGRVYVADTEKRTIVVFEPDSGGHA